jgi:hypothetical protein
MAINLNSFPKKPLKDKPKLTLKIIDSKPAMIKNPKALFNSVWGSIPRASSALNPSTLLRSQRKIPGQAKLSMPAFANGRQKIKRHMQNSIARSQYKKIVSLFGMIIFRLSPSSS